MSPFRFFMLKKAYENVRKNGDKLAEALIDWKAFKSIMATMYRNKTPRGGRPNVDEVTMIKILVLQTTLYQHESARSGQTCLSHSLRERKETLSSIPVN